VIGSHDPTNDLIEKGEYMRIVIMTSGTRGDIQPYIALGIGLQQAGAQVCLLTHNIFASMVQHYGLEFASLTGDWSEIMESDIGQNLLASGGNAFRLARVLMDINKQQQLLFMKDAQQVLSGADLLLYSALCFAGLYVAEALHIPAIFVPLQPILPTRAFPSPTGFSRSLGPVGNYLTHQFINRSLWQNTRSTLLPIRRMLGLETTATSGSIAWILKQRLPILLSYSPSVVPTPTDWPASVHTTVLVP
jgi:UDP:flavonoid glycosyltransferase YjiC (YdhE family)